MRKLLTILAILAAGAGQAWATADGPDFWRVKGVASNDVLNMRAAPSARATKIGEIPYDADGLTNLECVGGMSYAEFEAATEAEREAARRSRWCMVLYRDRVGWVSGVFLEEGDESDRPGSRMMFDHVGSEWKMTLLGDEAPGAEVLIRFSQGNKVSGNSGCNQFMGTFVQRGLDILIGDLAGTRKMCPEDVMRIESRVLFLLSRARTIAGGQYTMALFDGDGGLMATFRRTDWD